MDTKVEKKTMLTCAQK